ncbi:coiled-coil domain-containing protein 28A-like isoform X2 [Stegodyphus dumicola]|uniref:coiled-coil domain-containing protein 28A-like isoform X2 n=1 Tax=Stegodyphus dumicola TaxID=202533 RepID=UPI0015AFAF84|nr:coiled-coil domain-containing protein 28A-like isoform X2 [Stegodyphus dumicola]
MATDNESSRALPDLVIDIDNVDDNSVLFSNNEIPSSSNKGMQDCQTPNSQRGNKHGNKQLNCEEQKSVKTDARATPRRPQFNNNKGTNKSKPSEVQCGRSCEQHTFLTDITEVRQMEQGLLKLLDDFHSGKLQAFGKDCTFEKMEQVREQQERLARLHFELNAQQEIYGPQSEDGRRVGRENLGKLIENLPPSKSSVPLMLSEMLRSYF